jgi:hypothetical protein
MNIEERVPRLQILINEGRIIRDSWAGVDEQGREQACLLAALSPEVVEHGNASACPAELMPVWMAYLTPWIDDKSSEAAWPSAIRRYAACASRWSSLDEAAWRRVEIAARRVAVVEAMGHTTDERVLDACRGVLVWLDADMPESSRTAVVVAAAAAAGIWGSSRTAVVAAAGSSRTAVVAAAGAAAQAAQAAQAAGAAAQVGAGAAAWAAAADRIIDAILSALEKECGL